MIANYNLRKQILLFLLLFASSFMFGQTITPFLDPSLKFVKTMNTFNLVAERTDGKIWYSTVNSKTVLGLLDNDGTINSFTQDLLLNINALYPTNDNKVLVGGNFTTYNSTTVSARLLRLNSDGTRDFTFSASSNTNEVTALYILEDGKIMVGRNTQIQRLNSDGTTDSTFSTVTTNGKVNEFCISSTGKIFAVGTFTSVNNTTKNRAVLINTDGTSDTTFNIGTGFNAEVKGIRKTTTNNLYLIGSFTSYDGTSINKLAKLNETGTLNSVFHSSNTLFNDEPLSIEVSNDDKILVGGNFTNYNNQIVKNFVSFNEDGSINTSLNIGNSFENGLVKIIKKNTSENYIITGEFVKYNDSFTNQIVKIESNGNRVSTFNFSNVFNLNSFIDYISDVSTTGNSLNRLSGNTIKIRRQNDKILLSEVYINNKRYPLARFNNSGLLDNTFLFNHNNLNLPSHLKFSVIRDFSITPDNKLFLFLANTPFSSSVNATSFLRLNTNGQLDTSFSDQNYCQINFGTTENIGYVRNDNKIIWATQIHVTPTITYKGVTLSTNNFNLLQSNGDFDESYSSNSLNYSEDITNCNVNYYQDFSSTKLLPLPNNETLAYAVGRQTYCRFNGTSNNVSIGVKKATIGRFNSNGTIASDYLNLNIASVYHANYNNGFLYLGGMINNSTAFFKKIDLATNNEVTFNHQLTLGSGSSFPSVANTLFKDNKIYVVLLINSVWASDGTTRIIDYQVKRLNLDGTLDTTFSTLNIRKHRYSSDYNLNSIAIGETFQLELIDNPGENSFLIASRCPFTINGTYYEQAFVKIDFSSLSTTQNQFSDSNIKCYPNPTNSIINISATSETINQIKVYDMFGRLLKSQNGTSDNEKIDIQDLPNAIYFLEVKTDKGSNTIKIVKQ